MYLNNQFFFPREALGRRRSRGVSQMSRNGNALPMAGEPIGRCGIVFRGFRVTTQLFFFLREICWCMCVCVCQHGKKKTLLLCTLDGIALRKRPKFQHVESLRVAFYQRRGGAWVIRGIRYGSGHPSSRESFSTPVTMSM